jgi:hypothetical protein
MGMDPSGGMIPIFEAIRADQHIFASFGRTGFEFGGELSAIFAQISFGFVHGESLLSMILDRVSIAWGPFGRFGLTKGGGW